jgi:transposase
MPRHISEHLRQCKTYSEDLQKQVIYQKYTHHKSIHDISIDLDISRCIVERILKLWHDIGEVVPPEKGKSNKRRKIMTDAEIEVSLL